MDDGWRSLTLTNTMTRRKDAFRPLDWNDAAIADADKRVRMYVCGPTVYDFAHIGNARPLIVFDVLFRLLRHLYGAGQVVYARNITDVDDKINARAARDYPALPLNEAIAQVTKGTADQFHRDAAALGCLEPTFEPRATEFVTARADGKGDMVSMIATLLAGGHAYEAGGEVLFDVTSMPDYGRLSNRRLAEQQAGARVAVDAHKRNPGDFVLWKLSAENEPGWEAPYGRDAWAAAGRAGTPKGRPGWHIECSVMSEALLGRTFDIHGGGLDLIFPHHENEIAQSRCAHGTDAMAQVWMHNGYLQLEGRKMSKSDGNFVTIHDLLHTEAFGARRWPGEVLRLAMLKTHYREPIDFSVGRLEEAANELDRWDRLAQVGAGGPADVLSPDPAFTEALCDDLNVSQALVVVRRFLEDGRIGDAMTSLELLGIDPRRRQALDESAAGRIAQRLEFLKARNFADADRIRNELAAQGIQLKDGKNPETGERVTTWEVRR